MTDILAPVPARHLPSAEATFAAQSRVAFGSDAWEFWKRQVPGTPVWIVASSTGFPAGGLPGIDPGKVIFSGRLAATVEADRRHRHPNPDLRPASTESDGAWTLFFEVEALERMSPPLSVIGLRTAQGAVLTRVPHGPIAIRQPATTGETT